MIGAPAIAVVIPARRAGDRVKTAVSSALTQTVQPEEVIIVDDGDNGPTLAGLTNEKLRVVPGPRRGAGAARNIGLREARAEWVAFLDADDHWTERHLERIIEVVANEPEAGACFAAALHLNDDGALINRGTVDPRDATLAGLIGRRMQPTTSATAVRRAAALDVGGFYEAFRRPAGVEDIDLWWRIADSYQCLAQPEPTAFYVVHEKRDRARPVSELRELAEDRRTCIERLRGHVPRRLLRPAAAQHHAIMARYWLLAGHRRQALQEVLNSFRWAPTVNGVAAFGFAMLPAGLRERARERRRSLVVARRARR